MELFQHAWFIELLVCQLENTSSNNILRLFCVNKRCAQIGKERSKYVIHVSDDTNMPVYIYEYIYDTHAEAFLSLPQVMDEHPPFKSSYADVCFSIHRVYLIPLPETVGWWDNRYVNREIKGVWPKRLQRKVASLYHSSSSRLPDIFPESNTYSHECKAYAWDDMLPLLSWKKHGVELSPDLRRPNDDVDSEEDSDNPHSL